MPEAIQSKYVKNRYSLFGITPLAKRIKNYGKNSFPGRDKPKLTDDQKEIALLKKQLKDISEEHEMLKKVLGIFSKSDK